jgi:hypothetical protein
MQMKSIASRAFRYAGALVEPQTEFSVKSVRDSRLLVAARRAVLLAAAAPAVAPAPAAPASKRTYKRRDMVAEPAAASVVLEMNTPPAEVVPCSSGQEDGIADKPGSDQPEAAQDTPPLFED